MGTAPCLERLQLASLDLCLVRLADLLDRCVDESMAVHCLLSDLMLELMRADVKVF